MSETTERKVLNISRTGGLVNERIDKPNWMVIPSYEEVVLDQLEYQGGNFRWLVLFPEDERRKIGEISDDETIDIVKKHMLEQ